MRKSILIFTLILSCVFVSCKQNEDPKILYHFRSENYTNYINDYVMYTYINLYDDGTYIKHHNKVDTYQKKEDEVDFNFYYEEKGEWTGSVEIGKSILFKESEYYSYKYDTWITQNRSYDGDILIRDDKPCLKINYSYLYLQ